MDKYNILVIKFNLAPMSAYSDSYQHARIGMIIKSLFVGYECLNSWTYISNIQHLFHDYILF